MTNMGRPNVTDSQVTALWHMPLSSDSGLLGPTFTQIGKIAEIWSPQKHNLSHFAFYPQKLFSLSAETKKIAGGKESILPLKR